MRTLRILDLVGSPREIGRQHGEGARDLITHGIGSWLDVHRVRHGDADRFVERFLASTAFRRAIDRYTPALADELKGIAEGARQPLPRILAYNLMDEEWSFSERRLALEPPGCTVVGLRGSMIGQTMDIPDVHDGTQVALRISPDDGPCQVVFSAAGMIGLNGANDAGVGIVVNNLAQIPSSPNGLPVLCVLRGALAQRSAKAAMEFIASVPHAIGQHYLMIDGQEMIALEADATTVSRVPVARRYAHANHPVVARTVDPAAAAYEALSRTRERQRQAEKLLVGVTEAVSAAEVLNDTVGPISRAPRGGYMTFGATVIEVADPPRVRIAPGPPHQTAYSDVPFAALV